MGLDNRLATADEQKKMEELVAQAMKDGAVGCLPDLFIYRDV
jgi:N-acyl-D-aspartate/D-glutamate deacylase